MYAIYGNIYHQYTPVMLAYIPAPWILRSYGYDYVYVHDKTWIPHGVCFSCCIVYSWAPRAVVQHGAPEVQPADGQDESLPRAMTCHGPGNKT